MGDTVSILRDDLLGANAPLPSGPWVRLCGGQTNTLWRVGACVVKLFNTANDNPIFPNDAKAEARILTHLAGTGLAPRVLQSCQTSLGPVILYDHTPGKGWAANAPLVAQTLAKLHAIKPPSGLRRSPNGSVEIAAQTHGILNALPPGAAAPIAALEPSGVIAPTHHKTLLHGDPVPGNLIRRGASLTLIDWQCPAIGDACEDIAHFLSPAMQIVYRGAPLTPRQKTMFLAALDPDIAARYTLLAPWYHWRMVAYCAWKMAFGAPHYSPAKTAEIAALKERLNCQNRAGSDNRAHYKSQ